MYSIKEIYKTIQGEGAQSGQSAVFVRFSGCNLWSGKEKHRDNAICKFCDTDFVGTDGVNGGKYSKAGLAITKPNPKKIGTKAAKSVSLRLKLYFIGIRFLGSKKGNGTTFAFKFA